MVVGHFVTVMSSKSAKGVGFAVDGNFESAIVYTLIVCFVIL